MCVMEIHPHAHTSTMAIGMAHNTKTVLGDLDLLEEVLTNRGEHECVRTLRRARGKLEEAYAIFLTQFGYEVALEVADEEGHVHTHDKVRNSNQVGNERSFTEQAHHDASLARRTETR